jgi:hypothetical protein
MTRDIDHISVSVATSVTRDYRIDRNRTVTYWGGGAVVVGHLVRDGKS